MRLNDSGINIRLLSQSNILLHASFAHRLSVLERDAACSDNEEPSEEPSFPLQVSRNSLGLGTLGVFDNAWLHQRR